MVRADKRALAARAPSPAAALTPAYDYECHRGRQQPGEAVAVGGRRATERESGGGSQSVRLLFVLLADCNTVQD
eukprot:jgi/Chlat1/1524/Chrsp122S01816